MGQGFGGWGAIIDVDVGEVPLPPVRCDLPVLFKFESNGKLVRVMRRSCVYILTPIATNVSRLGWGVCVWGVCGAGQRKRDIFETEKKTSTNSDSFLGQKEVFSCRRSLCRRFRGESGTRDLERLKPNDMFATLRSFVYNMPIICR